MNEPGETRGENSRAASHICQYATEGSPFPLIATEGETHIVRYANPAFCRLFNKNRETLFGGSFVRAVPEEDKTGC